MSTNPPSDNKPFSVTHRWGGQNLVLVKSEPNPSGSFNCITVTVLYQSPFNRFKSFLSSIYDRIRNSSAQPVLPEYYDSSYKREFRNIPFANLNEIKDKISQDLAKALSGRNKPSGINSTLVVEDSFINKALNDEEQTISNIIWKTSLVADSPIPAQEDSFAPSPSFSAPTPSSNSIPSTQQAAEVNTPITEKLQPLSLNLTELNTPVAQNPIPTKLQPLSLGAPNTPNILGALDQSSQNISPLSDSPSQPLSLFERSSTPPTLVNFGGSRNDLENSPSTPEIITTPPPRPESFFFP